MRRGYSLLEVLLALGIAVLLLGALYVAIDGHLRLAQTGRNLVERSTLGRSVLARMETDMMAASTLCDAGRFRRTKETTKDTPAATTTAATTTTPAATTPAATTATPAATTGTTPGTTGATTGTSTTGTAGTTGTTASTTGTTTGTTTAEADTSAAATVSLTGPVVMKLGVTGDATAIHLLINKIPRESWRMPSMRSGINSETEIGVREDGTQLVSDLRLVSYWLVPASDTSPGGLARREIKIATTEQAISPGLPIDTDQSRYLIANEVTALQFEFFDGATWYESWDSSQLGADGKTPQGPPRAIRVTLDIDFGGINPGETNIKQFRHVVAISTANGTPMITEDMTTPTTGDTGTTGTTP